MFHKLKNERERASYIKRRRTCAIERMIEKRHDDLLKFEKHVSFGHGVMYLDDGIEDAYDRCEFAKTLRLQKLIGDDTAIYEALWENGFKFPFLITISRNGWHDIFLN